MTFDSVRPGDLIAVSSKGLMSNVIQAGTLSLPNIGPLGRWGLAGASHVGTAVRVFDQILVYESTSIARPRCARTGRTNPKGVQAHFLSEIVDAGGAVWHYPLRRPLYRHEEDRLLESAESALGRGYDFIGAGRAGGGPLMRLFQRMKGSEDTGRFFCSELSLWLWIMTGIAQNKHAGCSPVWLTRYARMAGICGKPKLLAA